MTETTPTTPTTPTWEQRVRAPQLLFASLLGPGAKWSADRADRGVVLANPSGRIEVYAFDAATVPAALTQVTDRPQGTMGVAMSRDASAVYWFDDQAGNEVGHWQRTPLPDVAAAPTTLLPDLPPTYAAGIVPLANGGAVMGRLVDDGFEIGTAAGDGTGAIVFQAPDPGEVVDATPDGSLALVSYAPDGDWLHMAVRVVRLADGAVIAELRDDGRNLVPVAFHPHDPGQVLVEHELGDVPRPMVWSPGTDGQVDVAVDLPGGISAGWYPEGDSLLLTVLHEARHRLFRLDRANGAVTPIPAPAGTVGAASARPDGSVHVLVSRSDMPTTLVRVRGDVVEQLIELPGEPPAPAVAATDVHAEGPGGRVHAMVHAPRDRTAPHPAVFMVHGGPTHQDYDSWNDLTAAFVDHGYAVVRVNYRGSTGYGAAWRDALHRRLGFIELEDITAVREALEADGLVDPERVAIAGGSWGGYLTLMALGTQPDRWRSGIALVPLADWFTSVEDEPPFMQVYSAALMGGTIDEIPDAYRSASPITYADAVRAPVFISSGANDPRCPVRQVDSYVAALRARGHDVRYDRLETGHAMPDLDMKVGEMRAFLGFLAATNPVA